VARWVPGGWEELEAGRLFNCTTVKDQVRHMQRCCCVCCCCCVLLLLLCLLLLYLILTAAVSAAAAAPAAAVASAAAARPLILHAAHSLLECTLRPSCSTLHHRQRTRCASYCACSVALLLLWL